MKTVFVKILLASLCAAMALGLVSCSDEGIEPVGYRVMKCSVCDCGEDPYPSVEYSLWYGETEQNDAPQVATVVFDGTEYEGIYVQSSVRRPNVYVSHRYSGENGVSFEIHGETGELTRIEFDKSTPSETKSQKECRKIADKLATQYVDVKKYTVRESKTFDGYSFVYYRAVDGLKSSDRLEIAVYQDGSILSFDTVMVGAMDGVAELPKHDEEVMEAALGAYLQEKYEGLTKYELQEDPQVVFLEDGSVAYLYDYVLVRIEVRSEAVPDEDGEFYYSFSRKNHLSSFLLKPVWE